eukprot:scaffold604341_cov17-Prasinocladus_malaysianus.AAC.1
MTSVDWPQAINKWILVHQCVVLNCYRVASIRLYVSIQCAMLLPNLSYFGVLCLHEPCARIFMPVKRHSSSQ